MANLDKAEFETLVSNALIKLPGASTAGIKTELFSVMKEFFTDSNAWTEDITFQAQAGTVNYLLSPLDGGQIIRLQGVWDQNGIGVQAFMRNFGTLRLGCAPSNTPSDLWTARVVKTVVLPTTKEDVPIAPDWALRVYGEYVMDGLIGRMMAHANKSYTNKELATYHLRRFRTEIQTARTAAKADNLQGAQAWAFPRQGMPQGSQRSGWSTAWPTRN